MTDNSNVKEFLVARIAELRGQLNAIVDAENKAATNLWVGKCYRYESMMKDKDGIERPMLRDLMRVVDAAKGDVVVVSMKFRISTPLPDVDVVTMGHENANSFFARATEISPDDWASQFQTHILEITRAATGKKLRFETVE